jgi:hypothetical protein
MNRIRKLTAVVLATTVTRVDTEALGKHGFADSGGVKIHFVAKGAGPLLVMVHGYR